MVKSRIPGEVTMGSTTKIPFDRIGKNQGAARWNKPVIVPGEMDEAHLKGALLILLSLISGREESTVFCKNDERTGLERMVCEKSRLLGDMILDFISEDLEFLSDGESSCGMETIVCFSREKVDEIDPSWMVFLFEKRKGAVGLSIRYNTSSYTRRMADNVADNFNRIAVGFLDFPEKSVEDTVFPDSLGRDQVLSCFNRSLGIPPLKDSVIKQFERVVDNYPDATALVFGSHKVSYRQLDKMACGVAEKIGELGIKKGEVAAISLGRSVSSIVAMLGIVKLGAAYMPIPASTPTDRALFMLEECEAKILIADNRELFRDISIPVFKIADESIPASSFYPKIEYSPDDLLYILYTSGTTGKPKGIMVENGSVTNALHWYASEYGLGIGKNLIQLSEISFDGSIYQIFGALLNGCTLHIPEKSTVTDMDELYGYIEREEIFLINFVPVILGELLGKRARIESLKYVLSGGDRLDHRIIDDLLEKGYELYNYYGPTETTMDAVRGKCEKEKISIGSPIPGVGCFVLDEKSRPVPVGFPGELYIGGAGVSRGYVKRDEQNRECFIRLPILKNMIVYKTGDLVRWMPNGEIAFIGRNDSQVKLNGYRIELGEVEDLMARFEGVIMAAAKVFKGRRVNPNLSAI